MERVLLLLLFFTSVACGTGHRTTSEAIREKFRKAKYDEALETLRKSKLAEEERSRLLFFMEEGLLLHQTGRFHESNEALERAKKLAQDLYTTRLSGKIASSTLSEKLDVYYGAKYEISLLHFYLSLNHFLISRDPKLSVNEQREALFRSRAEVLAWDTFLKSLRNERLGSRVYKDDLLAKLFGGFIHEAIGTRNDKQTALLLYREAKDILFQNYNAYETLNKRYQKFIQDFSALPKMPKENVEKEYVEATSAQEDLQDFLNYKILSLTREIRPGEYKRWQKRLAPSEKVVALLETSKKGRVPVTVLWQNGLIPSKDPKKYNFSLMSAMQNSEKGSLSHAAAQIGATALTLFAAEKLGLLPSRHAWDPPGAHLGLNVAQASAYMAGISFELPHVKNPASRETITLVAQDKRGSEVIRTPLAILEPLGDMAYEAVEEESAALYTKVGTRLALKHISAIATAYLTYKAMSGGNRSNDFFARNAAVVQYLATAKVIEQTETADTRYWSTLPHDVRMTEIWLSPGEYTFSVEVKEEHEAGERTHVIEMGQYNVDEENKLVNFRLTHDPFS